jgi:hypothetical protein
MVSVVGELNMLFVVVVLVGPSVDRVVVDVVELRLVT